MLKLVPVSDEVTSRERERFLHQRILRYDPHQVSMETVEAALDEIGYTVAK